MDIATECPKAKKRRRVPAEEGGIIGSVVA
jgi:hypothetical protein